MSLSYLELLEAHHRRSVRLKNHDYTRGTYFITICAKNGEHLFGEIVSGEMKLSVYGKIVGEEVVRTPEIRPNVRVDSFVVMPNHLHVIVHIDPSIFDRGTSVSGRGTKLRAPTGNGCISIDEPTERPAFRHIVPHSLGSIIRGFKSSVTQKIRLLPGGYDGHFWQRNYHEHSIQSKTELNQIRMYIRDNPKSWEKDRENIK